MRHRRFRLGLRNLGDQRFGGQHQAVAPVGPANADLAADPVRRADLRRTLRPRMAASPLTDGAQFTPDLEAAYRQMWRRWCAGEAPSAIDVA